MANMAISTSNASNRNHNRKLERQPPPPSATKTLRRALCHHLIGLCLILGNLVSLSNFLICHVLLIDIDNNKNEFVNSGSRMMMMMMIMKPTMMIEHSTRATENFEGNYNEEMVPRPPVGLSGKNATRSTMSMSMSIPLSPLTDKQQVHYQERRDSQKQKQQQQQQHEQHKVSSPNADRLETIRRLSLASGLDTQSLMMEFATKIGKLPPGWSSTIERKYGQTIPRIIIGDDEKDTGQQKYCERYRRSVVPNRRWVAPAGLFHTGTNLMANLLTQTCHWDVEVDHNNNNNNNNNIEHKEYNIKEDNSVSKNTSMTSRSGTTGVQQNRKHKKKPHWQVVYGKHNPIQAATEDSYRIPRHPYNSIQHLNNVMAVVMVRHPLDWIRSVCKQPFAISWNASNNSTDVIHDGSSKNTTHKEQPQKQNLPCPSLESDIYVDGYKMLHYSNLLELWKIWNRDYYNYDPQKKSNASHPALGGRIMVRLEDLVFAPRETLSKICECVGGVFEFNPRRLLKERQGGTPREESHLSSSKPNFLVEAWDRHANVDLSSSMLSAENRILFRKEMEEISDLMDALHYQVD